MTQLGEPLVFYLKYMSEMNRLWGNLGDGEEPDLAELSDDLRRVREMIPIVGDAASRQVADFLELCGKGIEDHFVGLGIAKLTDKRRRTTVVSTWSSQVLVHVSGVPGGAFYCGVWVTAPPEIHIALDDGASGIVVPWVWSKGGRNGEEAVWNILGGWHHLPGREAMFAESGTVALARIPIKAQPPESFKVDRDPLIAEVIKTFARIGAEETEAIARFGAGLSKRSDD